MAADVRHHQISHCSQDLTTVIAHERSTPCTPRLQGTKTMRWSNGAKKMQMGP